MLSILKKRLLMASIPSTTTIEMFKLRHSRWRSKRTSPVLFPQSRVILRLFCLLMSWIWYEHGRAKNLRFRLCTYPLFIFIIIVPNVSQIYSIFFPEIIFTKLLMFSNMISSLLWLISFFAVKVWESKQDH